MDPQVEQVYGSADWAVRRHRESLEELQAQGDELGLHPHAYRWAPERGTWLTEHADQDWLDHCVRTSFQAFEQSLGRRCASVRFGDRFLNAATLNLMESLGAHFDLTIEPGQPAEATLDPSLPFSGSLPDYSDYPRQPYQPSRTDLERSAPPGDRELWAIPLSAGKIEGWPGDCERALRRALRLPPPTRHAYRTLNLKQLGRRTFASLVEANIAALERPYLAVVIRTSAILTPSGERNVRENVETLLRHRLAERFVFSTPAEALALLGYRQAAAEARPSTASR
jgi:hypothetical protein